MGLKDAAFTGSLTQGNPYEGDLDKGIEYDRKEVTNQFIGQAGDYSVILLPYRESAKRLVSKIPTGSGDTILDIGSGTGIASLEVLLQYPGKSVVGIEISAGMRKLCQYKFHQENGAEFIEQVKDERILSYWAAFRKESLPFKNNATFLLDDFQKTDAIKEESIDAAISSQAIHWMDLPTAFGQLRRFLKNGASIVWSSASHFYDDSEFPAAEYGFRYNDFMKAVMGELRSMGVKVGDYLLLSRPQYHLDSLQAVLKKQGFNTKKAAASLIPIDLQVFVRDHVPRYAKELIKTPIEEIEKEHLVKQAIAHAITDHSALNDSKRKYEIVPVFISTKDM
jgi:ubiquinone/menaquinone biosynthesis C-methylase UbiE